MFDRAALAKAIAAHGRVARVVVADVKGSAPREVGAAMLVWEEGQSGTIGGGALEYQAAQTAREMLAKGESLSLDAVPLGPNLGQCCGGAVQVLTEVFLDVPPDSALFARPVAANAGPQPLAIARALAQARQGRAVAAQLIQGWFAEPMVAAQHPVWIWGAGHVGRALVDVMSPLPQAAITWIDSNPERFPETVPSAVRILPAAEMTQAALLAPREAHHLIVTYSHALDLALCDAVLRRGFSSLGLIGSATKWARFRARLAALGHSPAEISRICCPIGQPALGKHPQAIAIGVTASMIQTWASIALATAKEARA